MKNGVGIAFVIYYLFHNESVTPLLLAGLCMPN